MGHYIGLSAARTHRASGVGHAAVPAEGL